MLPAEHHKVLANIRKAEARTKRRKLAAEQQDNSDSEEEEEAAPKAQSQRWGTVSKSKTSLPPAVPLPAISHFPSVPPCSIEEILAESDSDLSGDEGKAGQAQKRGVKSQKGRAWLKEGQEDDPLNFLDPKVSHRVLGNVPVYSTVNEKTNVTLYDTCPLDPQPPTRP